VIVTKIYLFLQSNVATCFGFVDKLVLLLFFLPGHVEDLRAELDPVHPVVKLAWNPPSATLSNSSNVTEYDIRYGSDGTAETESIMRSVPTGTQHVVITRQSGLQPFSTAWFEVRARYREVEGMWSTVTMRIGMCKLQSLPSLGHSTLLEFACGWVGNFHYSLL